MVTFPNAKINIGLNVISRRRDGYHNLETVFYPVKINDVLEVIESDEPGFTYSGIEIPGHANENLCLRAYDLLRRDFDLPTLSIHLHKNIPIGAGLGGGSSDAAFFIKLLNEKFSLKLEDFAMEFYARQLGADCAFFIKNKPVFATEKGDMFEKISLDLTRFYLVVVKPPVNVSTGEAYRGVKPLAPARPLKELVNLPVEEWKHYINNDFEQSIFRTHAEIRGIKSALYESGALYSAMSGSGSSVFAIFNEKPDLSPLEISNVVFYGV